MAQESTLHIKLDRKTDEQLKYLARVRKTSKGRLAREAITACYQTSTDDLTLAQRQALYACQGGFISEAKLASIMGMHVLALRTWLTERGIHIPSVYSASDVRHA
jgi:predicted transcriptional regulator